MTEKTFATFGRKRILGINDDLDSCSCCGKTGLKRVVWIEDTETGAVACFGTTCAGKHAGVLFGEIKKAMNSAADENRRAATAEFFHSPAAKAYRDRERAWEAFKGRNRVRAGLRHFKVCTRFFRDAGRAKNDERARIESKFGVSYLGS